MKALIAIRQIFPLALLLALTSPYAHAVEVKGIKIPDHVTLPGSKQSLILNGTGMRTKFIFDIYVGALYLTSKSSDPKHIINSSTPKRIAMYFVYSKIEKEKMVEGWNEAFSDTLDKKSFDLLKTRIEKFNNLFPDIVKGDVVDIDFISNHGVDVSINNKRKGVISGAEFQRALLSIWLGDSPPNEDLKKGMLGIAEE